MGIPRELGKIAKNWADLARPNIINQNKMRIRFESTILYYHINFTDFTRLVQVGEYCILQFD
jgi:hypothetical protein